MIDRDGLAAALTEAQAWRWDGTAPASEVADAILVAGGVTTEGLREALAEVVRKWADEGTNGWVAMAEVRHILSTTPPAPKLDTGDDWLAARLEGLPEKNE